MLVFMRKLDEQVVIRIPGRDNPIVVQVCRTGYERVKLGFIADDDVEIDRAEIDQMKSRE